MADNNMKINRVNGVPIEDTELKNNVEVMNNELTSQINQKASDIDLSIERNRIDNLVTFVESEDGEVEIIIDPTTDNNVQIKDTFGKEIDNLKNEINVERNRINSISSLAEGSTTGDAELIDIRTGADGTVYYNAGSAVRNQVKDLSSQIKDKANKDEVVKKGYGTLNDFDEETRRKILDLSITQINAVLGYKNVIPENTNFIDIGTNKLNANKLQNGYLDAHNGEFTYEESGLFVTSDYIKVNSNDILYIKEFKNNYPVVFVRVCEYDNDKNFIKYIDINSNTYTVENTGYIRFYGYKTQIIDNDSKVMVTMNNETDSYEEFEYILNTSLIKIPKEIEKTKWYDKKGCAFGDSITQQGTVEELNGWQVLLNQKLNLYQMWNCGIGGSTVCGDQPNAMHLDERINAIPADSDFIIFMGGTNDWLQNKPLGDINSKDITTFYGALNVIVEKLFNRCPQSTILFCGTPYGKTTMSITSGLTQRDYSNCIRNIAEKYGIKYVDTMSEMECNEFNISYFYQYEDGNYIHPNTKGGKRLYEMMLKNLL